MRGCSGKRKLRCSWLSCFPLCVKTYVPPEQALGGNGETNFLLDLTKSEVMQVLTVMARKDGFMKTQMSGTDTLVPASVLVGRGCFQEPHVVNV